MEVQEKIIRQEIADPTGGYLFLTKILDQYHVYLGNVKTFYGMDGSIEFAHTPDRTEADDVFNRCLEAIK